MSKQQFELRMQHMEIRANDDGTMTVEGYVNEVGKLSRVLGGAKKFREKIKKGAFRNAIESAKHDIDLLAEHDTQKILASTANKSLELKEDDKGLYIKANIVNTSYGRDMHELIRSGIIQNMSFGFRVEKDTWKDLANGLAERTVEQLQLFEVSVVKNPAYADSNIAARNIDIVNGEQRAEEETVKVSVEDLDSILTKAQEMKEQYEALKEDIQALQKQLKNSENSDNEENQRSIEDELVYRRILNLKGEIH